MQVRTHHLLSTNLLHLEAVLHICDHAPGVVAVERRVVYYTSSNQPINLVVDIIVHEGDCWVKVFARKRKALHRKWLGKFYSAHNLLHVNISVVIANSE